MLKRFIAQFSLILLFVFAQMGSLAHAIEHGFKDIGGTKQSQQDQNNHNDPCKKCLSYAHLAGGLASAALNFHASNDAYFFTPHHPSNFQYTAIIAYGARAPPFSTPA